MTIPKPQTGLVLRYDFLWSHEEETGRDLGKERPVCIALTAVRRDAIIVAYLPITHSPPSSSTAAIEIPPAEKRRLGLDDRPSWIILTELNTDRWPDGVSSLPGRPEVFAYGFLSRRLVRLMTEHLREAIKARRVRITPRR